VAKARFEQGVIALMDALEAFWDGVAKARGAYKQN
jgi:hypothetical protein